MQRFTVEHRGCRLAGAAGGDGPPVLLVQGTGVGGAGWGPQVDVLARTHRCAVFDNRGFGGSQPCAERLSVDLMIADALAVLDHLGWDAAHVVGHSLGGLVAIGLAASAPARVRSLALLCTFASGAVPTRLTPGMLWTGLRARVGTRAMRRRAFLELVLSPAEHAALDLDALAARMAGLFGHDLADSPPIVMDQLRAMRAADLTAALPGLAVPTLVVSAEHDRLAPPAAGRAIASAVPGARYVELAGTGHAVPVVAPERLEPLLLEHLRG